MLIKKSIKIIESPRDAMQAIAKFIPTEKKIEYIDLLVKVGFDIVDVGSFVSPKAIPQLRDTAEVINNLGEIHPNTRLLAIVPNIRGTKSALKFDQLSYLGFPFSISDIFLKRNINSSIKESFEVACRINDLANAYNKELVLYLSMAFGNDYGEDWSYNLLEDWVGKLSQKGIQTISLSDTIGIGKPAQIGEVFSKIIKAFPEIEFGLHLHTTTRNWYPKIDQAFINGCRLFDGVLNGMGGCPMSGHELVGNVSTTHLMDYLDEKDLHTTVDRDLFAKAFYKANFMMEY